MPLFKVMIEREYVAKEGFEDYIEADTPEEAQKLADMLADHSNRNWPDHAVQTSAEPDDAKADYVEAVDALPPDFDAWTREMLEKKG